MFPSSDVRVSVDIKARADCRLLFGDSLLFTDAYFALWFVDSGMKAQTHTEWANNMNDLMTDISNGKERDLRVFVCRKE